MEAKFSKRLFAYIIDILILGLILLLFNMLIPESSNVQTLNVELDYLNEQYLNNEIGVFTYFNHYSEISYSMDKENVIYTIINIIFVIIYFIVIPYFFKGQTLGKKILKIRIIKENDKLTMNDLIIRNIIINGLGLMLISLVLVYLLPALTYFVITIILGLIQICLIIISVISIIKRDNRLGLHDKITNTKVINL